jgi:hypothetical protein
VTFHDYAATLVACGYVLSGAFMLLFRTVETEVVRRDTGEQERGVPLLLLNVAVVLGWPALLAIAMIKALKR